MNVCMYINVMCRMSLVSPVGGGAGMCVVGGDVGESGEQ